MANGRAGQFQATQTTSAGFKDEAGGCFFQSKDARVAVLQHNGFQRNLRMSFGVSGAAAVTLRHHEILLKPVLSGAVERSRFALPRHI
jgi:hypothetical protein